MKKYVDTYKSKEWLLPEIIRTIEIFTRSGNLPTTQEIVKRLGIRRDTIVVRLHYLEDQGKIKSMKQGKFVIWGIKQNEKQI